MSTEQNLNWRRSPDSPVGAGAAPPPSSLASGDHQSFCISFALLNLGGLLCSIDRLTTCFFSLRLCCKFTETLECFPLTHLYSPRQHPASFPELLCLSVLLGLCHGWCCVLSPLSLLFQ